MNECPHSTRGPGSVGWASDGGKLEETRPGSPGPVSRTPRRHSCWSGGCGRDRIRACVGEAGGFTGRRASSSGSPPIPIWSHDRQQAARTALLTAPAVAWCPARRSVGRREGGGKSVSVLAGPRWISNQSQVGALRRRRPQHQEPSLAVIASTTLRGEHWASKGRRHRWPHLRQATAASSRRSLRVARGRCCGTGTPCRPGS
jgi:hypothetical protein